MSAMFVQPMAPPSLAGPSSPTPIYQAPTSQPYTSQAQFTPPSSSETVSNLQSPISPRATWVVPQHLQMPTNQIRPRQKPLPGYMPAVLRQTEKPVRSSPPKNAAYGSPESLGVTVGGDYPAGLAPHLSRIVTEEWNEEVMGPVTGTPSRNHWKPDMASDECDDSACEKEFSFFTRRHHCRRCGRIFCFDHSQKMVPLDQHARFHPEGLKQRACNSCWSDFRTWEHMRASRSNSTNSRDSTIPGTPSIAFPGARGFNDGMKAPASIAKSVPRDWNWSTF